MEEQRAAFQIGKKERLLLAANFGGDVAVSLAGPRESQISCGDPLTAQTGRSEMDAAS